MRIHKHANLIPAMSETEFAALKADIQENGLLEPITTFKGQILDGRHRYRACLECDPPAKLTFWEYDGDDPVSFVWSMNGLRRHLTQDQLAAIGAEIADARKNPGGKGTSKTNCLSTDKEFAHVAAAKLVGSSPAQVGRAQRVKNSDPVLFFDVKAGKIKVSVAEKAIRDREKTKQLKAAERKAKKEFADQPLWDLLNVDVLDGLQSVIDHRGPARLIFTDPPYNIGVDYYGDGKQADKLPSSQYMLWVREWLALSKDSLSDDGSLWVMISDEFAAEYGVAIKETGFHVRSWIKWYETFGTNCARNFNRTSRHIFYCVRNTKRFVFNESAVTRQSDRQTKYNDKRAASGGKLWDDVWEIPRLAGTAKERLPDFPTQLPLALVTPIIKCASEPGDLVLDPFAGSATTGVAAIRELRKFIGIEKNEKACSMADNRLRLEQK